VLPTGDLRSGATSIGHLPEKIQRLLDLPGQGDGIEASQLGGEGFALGGGHDPGGEQALVGGLRSVVALADPGAEALLAEELADGTEEVELQPQQPVQALKTVKAAREL
jgi:hypothetical protein